MRLYTMSLVSLFLFNAFANAQSLGACQQQVNARYRQVLPVTIAADGHQIEIKLESSFWSGAYGLNILVDGQLYASFGEYARGFAFPVAFKNNRSLSSGYGKIQAGMEAYVHSASLQKARLNLDVSRLRVSKGSFGSCWIDGDSIEDVIAIEKETPAPNPTPTPDPTPTQPNPAPTPAPNPAPNPVRVGHDQSEVLEEGRLPLGKILSPNGDR